MILSVDLPPLFTSRILFWPTLKAASCLLSDFRESFDFPSVFITKAVFLATSSYLMLLPWQTSQLLFTITVSSTLAFSPVFMPTVWIVP